MKFYRRFPAGQPIAWAGDPAEVVASVVSGVVVLSQTLEDGRAQTVGLLLPSDFLGRPGRETVAFDASAAGEVTLCCFRRKPFERLLADSPHLTSRLLEMTLDELDAARAWMSVLGRQTARERVASLLWTVARRQTALTPGRGRAGQPLRLDFPLTREAMANCLGLTLETVSRQLGALARDGLLVLGPGRALALPDIDHLAAEIGEAA
ncbi:transcriptional activator protein FnrL [Oceanicola granulosus HTCC2516]|uniref:Transcriptional activator protein FnrL n=1 Tax=Oceanicola granulosus (strain ATCC BAA-861 / DSM 15982 / KCTC 12143 / HTCC2516) TaxID=314256 RepID=Q2CF74_OCEGH|nr:transcriptional activator protein FnrL [Oceanicola granulosus HTCC2516]